MVYKNEFSIPRAQICSIKKSKLTSLTRYMSAWDLYYYPINLQYKEFRCIQQKTVV